MLTVAVLTMAILAVAVLTMAMLILTVAVLTMAILSMCAWFHATSSAKRVALGFSTITPELNWSAGKVSGAAAKAEGCSASESSGFSGKVSASRKMTLESSVRPHACVG